MSKIRTVGTIMFFVAVILVVLYQSGDWGLDSGTDCEQHGVAAAEVAEIGGADVSSRRITEIR